MDHRDLGDEQQCPIGKAAQDVVTNGETSSIPAFTVEEGGVEDVRGPESEVRPERPPGAPPPGIAVGELVVIVKFGLDFDLEFCQNWQITGNILVPGPGGQALNGPTPTPALINGALLECAKRMYKQAVEEGIVPKKPEPEGPKLYDNFGRPY